MLELARAGRSALLVAATGAGKTLAGFLPTICDLAESPSEGLHTLYVSPLKALAVDVQRNLIGPIEEMGLPIRVETRTGDTPSDRKARQRVKPPQVLLTTPESLSLLLSYPDSALMFENLRSIVVDELHGFAKEKRGDLLSLSMSRLQKLAPGLRRVGLSATISDPDAYRSWLAPDADMELVDLVIGDPGAEPDLSILIPENKIPWGGHSGYHAIADVMRLIEQHKTTLVFSNTRGLAELIFQKLWDENDKGAADRNPPRQPVGRSAAQGRSGDGRRASCAGWSRPPASTSGSTGATSTSSSRWARRRALAPAAADRPRQPPARRAEQGHHRPRQPLRISRRRARRSTRSTTASSIPKSSAPARSTCSPSISWRWRSPRRSSRTSCSPKSAPPRLTPD